MSQDRSRCVNNTQHFSDRVSNNLSDSGQATEYNIPPPPELYQGPASEITNTSEQTNPQNQQHGGDTGLWDRASASGRNLGNTLVMSPPNANNAFQASNKPPFLNSTAHGMNTQGDGGFQSFNTSGNSPFVKGYTSPFPSRRESRNNRYSPYPTNTSHRSTPIPLTVRSAHFTAYCVQVQNFALLHQYHTQAAKVESKRYQVLCQQSQSPTYTTVINNMYDCYHSIILDQMEQNLQGNNSIAQTGPVRLNMESSSQQDDLSPLAAARRLAAMQSSTGGVAQAWTSTTETPPADGALASLQVASSVLAANRPQNNGNTQASISTPSGQSPSPVLPIVSQEQQESGGANREAVQIMDQWYTRNHHFPYPTQRILDIISEATELSVNQVNKWYSNRRQRDGNVKTAGERTQLRRERAQRGAAAQEQEEAALRQDIQNIMNTCCT